MPNLKPRFGPKVKSDLGVKLGMCGFQQAFSRIRVSGKAGCIEASGSQCVMASQARCAASGEMLMKQNASVHEAQRSRASQDKRSV